jgi:hypothetical protein
MCSVSVSISLHNNMTCPLLSLFCNRWYLASIKPAIQLQSILTSSSSFPHHPPLPFTLSFLRPLLTILPPNPCSYISFPSYSISIFLCYEEITAPLPHCIGCLPPESRFLRSRLNLLTFSRLCVNLST